MSPKCKHCGKQKVTSLVTYFVRTSGVAETKELCQDCSDSFVRYLSRVSA